MAQAAGFPQTGESSSFELNHRPATISNGREIQELLREPTLGIWHYAATRRVCSENSLPTYYEHVATSLLANRLWRFAVTAAPA